MQKIQFQSQNNVITIIEAMNMPAFVLAPISGVLMGAASASTTAGSVKMSINERMKLIPYEGMVGLTSTILAVIWYLI